MPDNRVIDVHCHLFNAQYALMELAAASWNGLWGNYPHRKGEGERRGVGLGAEGERRGLLSALEGIKDFAAYVARLVQAGVADCGESRAIARDRFFESTLGQGSSLLMAPLMMDIYFALDNNKDEEARRTGKRRTAPVPEGFAVPADQRNDFNTHLDDIAALVREQIGTIPEKPRRAAAGGEFDKMLEAAREELLSPPKKSRRGDTYDGIELSPGYKKHMHDLEKLAEANPDTVFPFLAVDPRRIGVLELIRMKVGHGRPFQGIKLYPPLGYLPTHPSLEPVFEHCAANDIPITLHCSDGGIQNFRKKNYVADWSGGSGWKDFSDGEGNKSTFYTAPSRWKPVMEKWRDLRINFAHFGGGHNFASATPGWRDEILAILQDHPNAYTDISYFTKPGLADEVTAFVAQHPVLASRLMFGTDYVMIMLDKDLGGLIPYFDRFAGLDRSLLADNGAAFLGI